MARPCHSSDVCVRHWNDPWFVCYINFHILLFKAFTLVFGLRKRFCQYNVSRTSQLCGVLLKAGQRPGGPAIRGQRAINRESQRFSVNNEQRKKWSKKTQMIIKMLTVFKLSVVNFCTPKLVPDLFMCVDLLLDRKIRTGPLGHRGLRAATPLGRRGSRACF